MLHLLIPGSVLFCLERVAVRFPGTMSVESYRSSKSFSRLNTLDYWLRRAVQSVIVSKHIVSKHLGLVLGRRWQIGLRSFYLWWWWSTRQVSGVGLANLYNGCFQAPYVSLTLWWVHETNPTILVGTGEQKMARGKRIGSLGEQMIFAKRMGFGDLRLFNQALLTRQAWRLL